MKNKLVKLKICEFVIIPIISGIFSYVIAVILDLLIGIDRREVRFNSHGLIVDRPGGIYNLLVYYLILTVFVVLLYSLFRLWYRKQVVKIRKVLIIILQVLVITGSILIYLMNAMPIADVENIIEIFGSVNNPNSYCYLFIRPIGSSKCWLQNPTPLRLDNYGKWRTEAYFGGTSGTKYEIILIASNQELEAFSKPGAYDSYQIPRNLKQFVRVVQLK